MLFLTFAAGALLVATVAQYRRMRADESALVRVEWSFDSPCYVCAGRLTTAGHYVGGNRIVCPDCYEIAQGVA